MIKDGWNTKKEAQQQPVAATQLFMHLFLSLLSFTFFNFCVVFNIFKASGEQKRWIKMHEFFSLFNEPWNSYCEHIKIILIFETFYAFLFFSFGIKGSKISLKYLKIVDLASEKELLFVLFCSEFFRKYFNGRLAVESNE
jgi:hypothetical protein